MTKTGLSFIRQAIRQGASELATGMLKNVTEEMPGNVSDDLGQSSSEQESVSHMTIDVKSINDDSEENDIIKSVRPLSKQSGEPEHQTLKK